MMIAPIVLYGMSLNTGVRKSRTHMTIMDVTKLLSGVLAPHELLIAEREKLPVVE
jgi:hypothetical protein